MGLIYLLFVVVAITAVALIAKVASRHNITSLDLATSLFCVGTILGAIVLCGHSPVKLTSNALLFSTIAGIGGSLAVYTFNIAVRSGHFGFSNAIYRSSFLIPVVYSVLFLHQALKWTTMTGIVLILAAIFLMSWATDSFSKGKKAEFRWFLIIFAAFLLSGAPRVGQTLTNACGEDSFLYLFGSYAVGALVLIAFTTASRSFNPRSLFWGSGAAVASYVGVLCTLKALETLKPQIVFPISLSGPIFLGVLISIFVFRERITPFGWMGIILGSAGITILAIWK